MQRMNIGLTTAVFMLAANFALAHGGDKPGPHGGAIQMPGAFHTEVVETKAGFEIYLLDMNFQNPSIKDASLKVSTLVGEKKVELSCEQKQQSFFCKKPKGIGKSGQLRVVAKRENAQGNEIAYELPIKAGNAGKM